MWTSKGKRERVGNEETRKKGKQYRGGITEGIYVQSERWKSRFIVDWQRGVSENTVELWW